MKLTYYFLLLFIAVASSAISLQAKNDTNAAQPIPAGSNSFRFAPAALQAYQEYLKLRLVPGNRFLQAAAAEQGAQNNGINIYLENCADLIQLIGEEDVQLFKKLKEGEEKRIKKIQALDASSPYYLFTQAEIKLQWGFIKLKFNEHIAAARNLKQAYELLVANEKKFPHFLPNKKSLGTLRILLSVVPPRYEWILNLMGVEGDMRKGVADLLQVCHSNDAYAREAQIIYILLKSYILNKGDDAIRFAQQTGFSTRKDKDDLVQVLVMAIVNLKTNHAAQALHLLRTAPSGSDYAQVRFIRYLEGEAYLLSGNYETAIDKYQSYLSGYKGKNYIKDCFYKTFLAYWMLNDSRATIYLQLIEHRGTTQLDLDKYAQKFASSGRLPHRTLMQARLLTDGGEYEKALKLLEPLTEQSFTSIKDMAEFHYRKARIYHFMERIPQAIAAYEKTISLQGQTMDYLAPNAALQLGYIQRDFYKDYRLAKKYFEKALSYESHEYKNSIDNKAKAALSEMN